MLLSRPVRPNTRARFWTGKKSTFFWTKQRTPCVRPLPCWPSRPGCGGPSYWDCIGGILIFLPALYPCGRALIKLASGGTELKVTKNGHGRVVDLPADSVEALRAHRGRNPETSGNGNFVFCHSDGSLLDPDLVSKWFRKAARKAGLEGLRLHDLRHTHAP